jgi:hypothetical protein
LLGNFTKINFANKNKYIFLIGQDGYFLEKKFKKRKIIFKKQKTPNITALCSCFLRYLFRGQYEL